MAIDRNLPSFQCLDKEENQMKCRDLVNHGKLYTFSESESIQWNKKKGQKAILT